MHVLISMQTIHLSIINLSIRLLISFPVDGVPFCFHLSVTEVNTKNPSVSCMENRLNPVLHATPSANPENILKAEPKFHKCHIIAERSKKNGRFYAINDNFCCQRVGVGSTPPESATAHTVKYGK